ncbi:Transcriptional regulator [Stigmatella aurantiaca DW4/3-1]|uniref:Transcriptional regulator n=2 Tax=Stigmatella aurantiaca TaxID=41 RepID=E3FJ04_STIAD|nr:Transcriptional regulator [Stigmatella aurantiaca DW4/3-1]
MASLESVPEVGERAFLDGHAKGGDGRGQKIFQSGRRHGVAVWLRPGSGHRRRRSAARSHRRPGQSPRRAPGRPARATAPGHHRPARQIIARQIEAGIGAVEHDHLMAKDSSEAVRAKAISTLSTLVGAVAMARAVNDEKLSLEILKTAAEALKARLG